MSRRASAALASVVLVLSVLAAAPVAARDDFRSGVWEGGAHPSKGGYDRLGLRPATRGDRLYE